MTVRTFMINFVSTFVVVFIVASFVSFLWNLVFHAAGIVDWETSFRLAIILGIILPWVQERDRRRQSH
ncbi:MAG: hypothetical protein D6732_07575 [Methanobacteriota archaeon]|nr:MAG: hypothetical protein D6732_07575 [Euryarchaeota archaeon]